tara:strand:+ start:198 stop:803 length:606 start_codon:yes stop_codon:yes gene_type:complete
MFKESSMSLNDLYRSICLAKDDDDTFEIIVENQSVIWGSAYDVVNAAMELIGNIEHEYTSKHDSPTLDSVLTVNGTTLEISANPENGDNHEVIVGLSKLLDGYELLFLSESNGNSDLAFVIDTKENAQENRIKYGYRFSLNFVPVAELPDLWNTPGNQLDAAVDNYAKPQNQQLTRRSTGLHILAFFFAKIRKKISSLFRR